MEKYIFFDIDGVLNELNSFQKYSKVYLQEEKNNDIIIMKINDGLGNIILSGDFVYKPHLDLLKEAVSKTDAKLVGISTWFSSHDKENIERTLGLTIEGRIKGLDGDGTIRQKYIYEYLKGKPNVKYVIFDDIKSGFNEAHICVDSKKGLTRKNIEKAISILNN